MGSKLRHEQLSWGERQNLSETWKMELKGTGDPLDVKGGTKKELIDSLVEGFCLIQPDG